MKIFSTISKFIGNSISKMSSFPGWAIQRLRDLVDHLKKIKANLKDLTGTNLKLGIYHLYRNNLSDAVFRLKIVDNFLDRSNEEANYYLGWTYLKKGDFQKAIHHLAKAGKADEIKLHNFIQEIDNISEIPMSIETMNRNITAEDYIDQFTNSEYYLPLELVNDINSNLINIPDSYSVLELGCNVGLCGAHMHARLPEEFTLTGIETSSIMHSMLQNIETSQQTKYYSQLHNVPVQDFLAQNRTKFNVITSFNGFSFTSNLDELFSQIKLSLTKEGIFAFTVRGSSKTHLDKSLLEFSYDENTIKQALKSNHFEIISERELKLEKNNKFYIFLVKST